MRQLRLPQGTIHRLLLLLFFRRNDSVNLMLNTSTSTSTSSNRRLLTIITISTMDIEAHHIPHFEVQTLIEVGVVVGLFGLAIGCLACSLNGPKACEGCSRPFANCWKRLLRRRGNGDNDDDYDDDDDDDDDSYIGDDDTESAPHVFESLNELVFFEEQQGPNTAISSDSGDDQRLLIPTSMEKIFPDLLGPGAEHKNGNDNAGEEGEAADAAVANGASRSDELREPLL